MSLHKCLHQSQQGEEREGASGPGMQGRVAACLAGFGLPASTVLTCTGNYSIRQ